MNNFSHKPTLDGDLVTLRPLTAADADLMMLRDPVRWDGESVDATVMSILAPDWAARQR